MKQRCIICDGYRQDAMKPKHPVRPEQFKRRCQGIIDKACNPATRCMLEIAPIANMECQMVVESYYGGKIAAGRALIRQGITQKCNDVWIHTLLKITDGMGWTKVYHMPNTDTHQEYWHRHGHKCSGSPNCNDFNCIEKSLPRWFKFITRWKKR